MFTRRVKKFLSLLVCHLVTYGLAVEFSRRENELLERRDSLTNDERGQRPLLKIVNNFDDIQAALKMNEEIIIVNQDINVQSTIFIGSNSTISSRSDYQFAFDGQDYLQLLVITSTGDLLLQDLIFRGGLTHGNGGAISILGGSVEMIHCTLTQNSAVGGGAIYISGGNLIIHDSTFTENSARDGGVVFAQESTMILTGTKLLKNFASNQAGAILSRSSNVKAEDCEFEENEAKFLGGAIVSRLQGTFIVSRSSFRGNRAKSLTGEDFSRGGASYLSESTMTITDCTFETNVADEGGAIATFLSDLKMSSSSILRNSAHIGGGFSIKQSSLNDYRSDFFMNRADIKGGGIYLSSRATLNMTSTVLEENLPDEVSASTTSTTASTFEPLSTRSIDESALKPNSEDKHQLAANNEAISMWPEDKSFLRRPLDRLHQLQDKDRDFVPSLAPTFTTEAPTFSTPLPSASPTFATEAPTFATPLPSAGPTFVTPLPSADSIGVF